MSCVERALSKVASDAERNTVFSLFHVSTILERIIGPFAIYAYGIRLRDVQSRSFFIWLLLFRTLLYVEQLTHVKSKKANLRRE